MKEGSKLEKISIHYWTNFNFFHHLLFASQLFYMVSYSRSKAKFIYCTDFIYRALYGQ